MLTAASDLPEDPALLKAMIAQLQAQNAKLTTTLRAHDLVVRALRLQIARLRKQAFGKSSEKIEREIEQLDSHSKTCSSTSRSRALWQAIRTIPRRKPRSLLPTPAPGRIHPGAHASRRIRRANATRSTLAAPVPIAGVTCVSLAKT